VDAAGADADVEFIDGDADCEGGDGDDEGCGRHTSGQGFGSIDGETATQDGDAAAGSPPNNNGPGDELLMPSAKRQRTLGRRLGSGLFMNHEVPVDLDP